MSWRRELAKLGALFRRPKPVADLEEEIRSHLAMEEQENLEAEKLLVAVGRKPNSDQIGLENTKVELDRGFKPI